MCAACRKSPRFRSENRLSDKGRIWRGVIGWGSNHSRKKTHTSRTDRPLLNRLRHVLQRSQRKSAHGRIFAGSNKGGVQSRLTLAFQENDISFIAGHDLLHTRFLRMPGGSDRHSPFPVSAHSIRDPPLHHCRESRSNKGGVQSRLTLAFQENDISFIAGHDLLHTSVYSPYARRIRSAFTFSSFSTFNT
jgi:hypothetical protein